MEYLDSSPHFEFRTSSLSTRSGNRELVVRAEQFHWLAFDDFSFPEVNTSQLQERLQKDRSKSMLDLLVLYHKADAPPLIQRLCSFPGQGVIYSR